MLFRSERKVKFAMEQAAKAQGKCRYSFSLSLTSALGGVGGQSHAQAVLLSVINMYLVLFCTVTNKYTVE